MSVRVSLFRLLFSCGVLLAGCRGGDFAKIGEVLPFRLPTAGGGEIRSTSLDGAVVLLEFWATWCSPCHIQAKILAELAPELDERGVKMFSVNYGEEAATVRSFLAEHQPAIPVLLDESRSLADRVGIAALPAVLVLDRRGALVAVREGIVSADAMRDMVRRAQDSGE